MNTNHYPESVKPLFIRRAELPGIVGISLSSIRRLEAAGDFPARRKLGPGVVGWSLAEVQAWAATRDAV